MIFTKNVILSFIIISVSLLKSVVSSAGTLKVSDAIDSKLYQGPKNPRRSDLSSYILRADKNDQKPSKYFTGSPKPIWDEPPSKYLAPIYHTISCTQAKSLCSSPA